MLLNYSKMNLTGAWSGQLTKDLSAEREIMGSNLVGPTLRVVK